MPASPPPGPVPIDAAALAARRAVAHEVAVLARRLDELVADHHRFAADAARSWQGPARDRFDQERAALLPLGQAVVTWCHQLAGRP